jgi:hypothetical protein
MGPCTTFRIESSSGIINEVENCQSCRIRLAAGHIPAEYVSAENAQAWTPNRHKLFNVINLLAGQIERRSHLKGKLGTQRKIIEPSHSECGSRIHGYWSSTSIRPQGARLRVMALPVWPQPLGRK